jgi:TRAP-type C4-dicarboxylate transport system substrate-binding protein
MKLRIWLGCGLAVALSLPAQIAAAQEVIKLTVVAGHPPNIAAVEQFIHTFKPKVAERLQAAGNKYRIEWNEAYSGTIAKPDGVLEAIEQGLGDVGLVPVLFDAAKLPLENVTYYAPFGSDDLAAVTRIMQELHDKVPAMRKAWERYNQVFLAGAGIDTYHLITNFPVTKLEDLKGHKIGAPGPAANWVTGTGAVAVGGTLNTYYNDIKTGVYDGAILYGASAGAFKIYEVAPHFTKVGFGAQYANALTVNSNAWKKLPPEVRKVFEETALDWQTQITEATNQRWERSLEAMTKAGTKITVLPQEERKKWAAAINNVAKKWASDQEAKGVPAKAVLSGYMDGLRASGAPVPRNWDKE